MGHLDEVPVEELQNDRNGVEGNKPTQRCWRRSHTKRRDADRTCRVARHGLTNDLQLADAVGTDESLEQAAFDDH